MTDEEAAQLLNNMNSNHWGWGTVGTEPKTFLNKSFFWGGKTAKAAQQLGLIIRVRESEYYLTEKGVDYINLLRL